MAWKKSRRITVLAALCVVLFTTYWFGFRYSPVTEIAANPATLEKLPDAEFSADDWPWWRGPSRNGLAAGAAVPVKFSETENVIWKAPLPGRGHSSPTVIGDRIF